MSTAILGPALDILHLNAEHRALNTFEPVVKAFEIVVISALSAPVAQYAQLACIVSVAGGHRATLAIRAQVLAWVKAEAAHVANAADAPPLVLGAMRLRGILDQYQVVPPRDRQNRVHIGRAAIQVHRQDRLGTRRDRGLDLGWVDCERLGVDVD